MAKKESKKKSATRVEGEGREAALKRAIKDIDERFGAGAVMRLGDQDKLDIGAISTGSMALDKALGIGGIPIGRITEIYGPESSGKTTVALHIIAECQKTGGTAAFIDAEHALDPIYAEHIGVDTANLLISQPDNGEQALEICDALVRSGAVDIVVVDSVAALTPRAEIEGEMGDTHVGLLARLMSQALRKLTANTARTGTTLIFINQVREKIGVVYGNPEVTTGGRALKFYSSVRLEVRRGMAIKKGDEQTGNRTSVKVVKNKVAPPFKKVEFDIMYGEGISISGGIVDVGAEMGIINKSGSWYSYKDERLGQGRDNAKAFLEENPELMEEIRQLIMAGVEEPSAAEGAKATPEDKEPLVDDGFVDEMNALLDEDFLDDDNLEDL
ncbi:recombinase RecA [Peptococcus simiae]|uniref:recombinase RecA n=1 Tax=Peptococcus simiae TaxID=1643805 RepID=UPI00397EFB2C